MKTRITRTLLILLTAIGWFINVHSQTLTVRADSVNACPGDAQVVLPIYMEDFFNAGSINLTIIFDTNTLSYHSYQAAHPAFSGGGVLFVNNPTNPGNEVKLAFFTLGLPFNGGTGKLIEYVFDYSGGTSTITWSTDPGVNEVSNPTGTIIYNLITVPGFIDAPAPLSITSHPVGDSIDEGVNTIFSITAVNAVSYQWQVSSDNGITFTNVADDTTYSGSQTVQLMITATPLGFDGNLYRCIASEPQCNQADTSMAALLQVEEICIPPLAFNITGGGAYCLGGAGLPIGLSNSETGVNYYLFLNGDSTGQMLAGNGSALSFGNQTLAGTYTISGAKACASTNMTGSAAITINPLPNIWDVTGGGSYCDGGSGQPVGLSSSDTNTTYTLYLNGAVTSHILQGNNAAQDFGVFTTPGNYTVQAVNTFGCNAQMNASATISINPLPTAYPISGGGAYCDGGNGLSIQLSGSQIGVFYFLWKDGSPTGTSLPGSGAALSFDQITAPGIYTIEGIDTTSLCVSAMTGSISVSINPLPILMMDTLQAVCLNAPAFALNIGTPAGGTYAGAGVSTGLFNPATAGSGVHSIQYSYTDTNGCTSVAYSPLSVSALPSAFSINGGGAYCPTGQGPEVGLDGSESGVTYQLWLNDTTLLASLNGTGNTLPFGPQTAVGSYTVKAIFTSQTPACEAMMTGSVQISTLPLQAPLVSTDSLGSPGTTSVEVFASVDLGCGSPVLERGVVYGMQTAPTLADNVLADASAILGSFSLNLTGLQEGTTYFVRAYATNNEGTTYGNELIVNTLETPYFLNALMQASTDQLNWMPVNGNLANGFDLTLNPTQNYYYLDFDNSSTQTNVPLANGGYFGFSVTSYPADFFTYWDSRGVNAGAAAGSWQAVMWQIINGNLPTFLIKVNPDGSLMLVDGLGYALGQPDDYLRINGSYLLGDYSYSGTLTGANGVNSQPVNVNITFNGTVPYFNTVALQTSTDKTNWTDVAGSLAGGFALLLDSTQAYYYLDMKNPETQTNIPPAASAYFGFYFNTYPADFFNYWDGRGVNAGSTSGTWQATMWDIINGSLPVFYIKTDANGDFTLVDGLQYALGLPDDYLRINGDYLVGNFSFAGLIEGVNGVSSDTIIVPLTITRQCIPPIVASGPSAQTVCEGDDAVFSFVLSGSSPFTYQWRYNGVDIAGANNEQLVLQNVATTDAGLYSCFITNDCGDTLSPEASLTVNQPPMVQTQPISQNTSEGSPVSFSIAAIHATSYQWQVSANGGQSWMNTTDGLDYAGSQTQSLMVINPMLAMNGYTYRCVASGLCSPDAISDEAGLIVTKLAGALITRAPHMTATPGDTILVAVDVENAYGVSAIALTMQYDASVLNFIEYRNANAALAGQPVFVHNAGSEIRMQWFSLLPSNIGNAKLIDFAFEYLGGYSPLIWKLLPLEACEYGNFQSQPLPALFYNGSVNAQSLISILSQPENDTTCPGSQAGFSVSASGVSSYAWEISTDGGSTWASLSADPAYTGAGTAQLHIPAASAGMHLALYRCALNDGISTIYTSPAYLVISPWANLNLPLLANPGTIVCSGTPIDFSVPGDSLLINPMYNWYLNGVLVGNASTYQLSNPVDGDVVVCDILSINACAAIHTTSPAVSVDPLPSITVQPLSTSVYEGDTAYFSVTTANLVTYQWQGSTNGGNTWTDLVDGTLYQGSNQQTLSVQTATLAMDGYLYRCILTEINCGLSLTSGQAMLDVKQLPIYTTAGTLTACPGDQIAVPVTALNFNNVASASLRLSYDTNALSFIGFQNVDNGFSLGTLMINQNQDQISIAFFGLNPVNIGNGLLFEILFTYHGGTADLIWDPAPAFTMYTNTSGQTLEAYFNNGQISSKPLPLAFNVSGGGSYCVGGNGVVVALDGSETGIDYALFVDGNPTGTVLSGTGSALSFGNQLAAGVYTVMAENVTTGCTNTMNGNAIIIVDPLPIVSYVSLPDAVCANDTAIVLAGGMPAGGIYSGPGVNAGVLNPSSLGTGIYTITYTYTDTNGCINSATDDITVNPVPVLVISPANPVICVGESILLSTPGGNDYLWSTGDTTSSISVSPLINTLYAVTATNTFGCSVSAETEVVVNPVPSISISTSDDTICESQWVTLTANGAANYAWSTGSTSPSITVSPATSHTYTVTGTNGFGCSSVDSIFIFVYPQPNISIAPVNPQVCNGESIQLTASGALSYLWDNGSILDSIMVSPNVTTQYALTGTDANGCSAATSITVTVNPLPSSFSVTGGGAYCTGSTGVAVGLDGSESGIMYHLLIDALPSGQMLPGTGFSLDFGLQTQAGVYTVLAEDTLTLCNATMAGQAVVSIDPLPVFTTQPVDITVNIGGTAIFTADASPANAYQWQLSTDMGASWINLTNGGMYSGVTTTSLSVGPASLSLDGNWYRLEVSAASCVAYSNPALLTINPIIPTLTTNLPDLLACPGDTLLIPVTVSGFNFVGSFDLDITFDAAVLSFSNVLNPHPALATGVASIVPGAGSLHIDWSGGPAFIATDTLAVLEMIYSSGNSNILWSSTSIYLNGFGDTIPTVFNGGSVNQASLAPVVNTQAQSLYVFENDTASFTIQASGANAYQWQVSTDGGNTWTNLSNGTLYAGTNTATLLVQGASLGMDANWYRCLVSEAVCGLEILSDPATLNVVPQGLTILTSISNQTACPGNMVTFPVEVTNFYNVQSAVLTLTYDNSVLDFNALVNTHPAIAAGSLTATEAGGTLTIQWNGASPLWPGNATLFDLEFQYLGGSTGIAFDTTTVGGSAYYNATMQALPAAFSGAQMDPASQAPVITSQPMDLTVMETVPASFSVATSVTGVSYQWEMSIDAGLNWLSLSNGAVYNGVNTATLEVLSPTLAMDGYQYRVMVSDTLCGFSTISSVAEMTVIPFNTNIVTTVPDIIACPDTIAVPVLISNASDVFSISLKLNYDTARMQYLGYQNPHPALAPGFLNVFAANAQVGIGWMSLSEAVIQNDTLLEILFVYSGGYASLGWDTLVSGNCQYSNLMGMILDDEYHDGSVDSPGPTILTDPADLTVDDGDTASFSITAVNATAYQWQISTDGGVNWTNLSNTAPYSGVHTMSLLIAPASLNMDGYLYRAMASGSCPAVYSNPAVLSVNPPLPLVTTSIGTMNSCAGNISIPVRVANLIGAKSFNLALWFNTDSLVLNYTGYGNVHPALATGSLSVSNVGDSLIQISFSTAGTVNVGTDSLLTLFFTSTGGNTNLRWNTNDPLACEYLDPQGYSFPEQYLNGSIRVQELPLATMMPMGPDTICVGGTTTSYMIDTVRYADYYLWSITPSIAGTVLGSTNTATVNWNPVFTGSATITVTAWNNCGAGPTSPALSVFVNTLPGQAANATGPTTLCINPANTVYTTAGASNATGYQWKITPASAATLIPNGNQVSVDWNNSFTGYAVLNVRGINDCGAGLYSSGLLITVHSGITVNLGPDVTTCASTSVTLNAGNPGATYLWSTGATTQSITVDSTGLGLGTFPFSVTVTSNVGCQASDVVNITFDPCVGVAENPEPRMHIYPNPSQGSFFVALDMNTNTDGILQISNMLGEVVFEENIAAQSGTLRKSIDLSHLPAGLYLVSLQTEGIRLMKKAIIQ